MQHQYSSRTLLDSYDYNPVQKTHYCENVTFGDKVWSTTLNRAEKCPACGKIELDKDGNFV